MIRVLLVDHNGQFRSVLRRLLEREPDIEVVHEADNGRSAVDSALELHPDLVLMDVMMPDLSGYEVCRQITSTVQPHPPSVILVSA